MIVTVVVTPAPDQPSLPGKENVWTGRAGAYRLVVSIVMSVGAQALPS